MAQAPATYIGVFYGRNGTAVVAQDFTKDHELATKALRIPYGGYGAFTSPYLSLRDLVKRMPGDGERRSILLISSGIDYFRGNFGPTSPDWTPRSKARKRQHQHLDFVRSRCRPWRT